MNNSLKGITIAAAAMLVGGLILAGIGFLAGGNQPIHIDREGIHVGGKLNFDGGKTETMIQELDHFSSIRTDLDLYDVELIESNKYAIETVFNPEYGKPDFRIENDTLIVESKSKYKVNLDLNVFNINSGKNLSVKIYYPKTAKLKDVAIHGDAADLSFHNLAMDTAEFQLDYGKLDLSDISARTIKVSLDSGDCTMKQLKADDLNVSNDLGKTTLNGGTFKTLEIKSNSGDVALADVTADHGNLQLDLGKLSASNLTANGLKAQNDSGDINLQGKLTGTTDVTCNLGKVTITPGGSKDEYSYELQTDLGSVSVDGEKASGSVSRSGAGENNLIVKNDMGDINIQFE